MIDMALQRQIAAWSRDVHDLNTYVVEAVGQDVVKIGRTKRLSSRLSAIQTHCPNPIRLIALLRGDVEGKLHTALRHTVVRGEWFRYTDELADLITSLPRIPTQYEIAGLTSCTVPPDSWKANRR